MVQDALDRGVAGAWRIVQDAPGEPPRVQVSLAEDFEPEVVLRMFEAVSEGECDECGSPIGIGDPIEFTSDDRYLHESCSAYGKGI